MSQNLDKPFLYQINFNRRKFPEVCERLEEMKASRNGLAWYLRQLIEKDIEEQNNRVPSKMVQIPVERAVKEVVEDKDTAPKVTKTVKKKEQPKQEEAEEKQENIGLPGGGFSM
ncbi:hypothetical protein [Priestia megaterium]|uniref:hypothetical protein n=1 Tax=Priestia megaterium TaxID=1404 RepID=UPI000BEC09D0|nr:hypothetical protein [Priestia megaterium]PED64043.1 hypothetical protein CON20_24070 [Priestia megaterium]